MYLWHRPLAQTCNTARLPRLHLAQTLRQDSAAKSAALEEQKATLAAYVRDTKSKRSALEQRYVSLGEQFERLSDRYDTLLSESAQNSSRAEVAAAAADAKAAQERLRAQERGHARAIGVSNFCSACLECLLGTATTAPMVNQVEMHGAWAGLDPWTSGWIH